MTDVAAYFVGEDSFGRPAFKGENGRFYCLTDVLCGDGGKPPSQEVVDKHPVIIKNGGFNGEPQPSCVWRASLCREAVDHSSS